MLASAAPLSAAATIATIIRRLTDRIMPQISKGGDRTAMMSAFVLLIAVLPTAGALRLAVTGAAGYLGAEVACLATEQGHSVRAVVKEGPLPAAGGLSTSASGRTAR